MAKEDAEARTKKEYVRTFIFSMKVGTPVEKLHVITKALMIIIMSVVALYMFDIPMSKGGPDIIGLVLLLALVFVLLGLARSAKYLVTSYLLLALPVLFGEFFWWLFFNRDLAGPHIPFYIWPGYFPIGISTVLLLVVFFGLYYRMRSVMWPLIAALILWFISITPASLDAYPFTWFSIKVGGLVAFTLPSASVTVAIGKALGYGVLIYTSFLFLLTTRDTEIAGALRQLKASFRAAFFAALMFRNLNIILIDYENIRTAQRARGAEVRRRNIFARIVDLAYIAIPLVASMIKRSTEMGVALYARGFENAKKPVDYKETKGISYMDVIVIAIMVGFLVYTVILGHTIRALI
ncbi:MAG: energy-coupling factor transporter transmembrane component T [Conexivisphaerales archaeon]